MKTLDDMYAAMTAEQICEMIGQPYKKMQKYCITACYNTLAHRHGDRKPSLTVYGRGDGYFCYACGEHGTEFWLLKQFGAWDDSKVSAVIDRTNFKREKEPMSTISTDEYCKRLMAVYESLPPLPDEARRRLETKGFEAEVFEEMPNMPEHSGWKWHSNQVRNWSPGIFIPYMFEGRMITARLRRLNPSKGTPKFLSMPGNTMWPYNLDAVMRNKRVFVTEGETDALTLNFVQSDVPAVGIPGATSGVAIARLIEQAACYNTELIVLPDNDEPGQAFANRIRLAAFEAKVPMDVGKVPAGNDVNEWYQQATPEQLGKFFKQYRPSDSVDPLATVREVFGDIEVVTRHPDYQKHPFATV